MDRPRTTAYARASTWITETAVEAGTVAESAISSAATVQVTRS